MRTITIRPARWRTWGFCVSFTVSSMRATGPGPPKRCARALASVPRHAGTSILVCEVEGSCVSTCTLVGCPNFSRSGRPFDAQRKCCDVPRPAQTGLWSKGRSTRDRGGPPTGMLPRKLMTGSRRQETLRAFMRRQECKGGEDGIRGTVCLGRLPPWHWRPRFCFVSGPGLASPAGIDLLTIRRHAVVAELPCRMSTHDQALR